MNQGQIKQFSTAKEWNVLDALELTHELFLILPAKDDLNDDKYDFFHPSPEFGGDVKRFYKDLLCMKKGAEL